MRVILQEAGTACTVAENGLEAVEHARKADFDVILMDMNMPVMDGYTATRKLRQQGYDKPIIALTAHAMESAAQECRNAGCTGFLSKPIDFNLLMTTLAEIAGVDADSLPVQDSSAVSTEVVDPESTGPIHSTLNTVNPKFHAIVVKFVKRLPEQLEAMSSALANGDFDELADLAHWLKGSGPNVGFAEFGEPAKLLEESAHQGDSEQARRCFLEIGLLSDRVAVDGDVSGPPQQPIATTPSQLASAHPSTVSVHAEQHGRPLVSTLPAHTERFHQAIVEFVDQLDERLERLKVAADAGDIDQLTNEISWLKDSSVSCGFPLIAETASGLESCRDDHHDEVVQALYALRQRIQLPVGDTVNS